MTRAVRTEAIYLCDLLAGTVWRDSAAPNYLAAVSRPDVWAVADHAYWRIIYTDFVINEPAPDCFAIAWAAAARWLQAAPPHSLRGREVALVAYLARQRAPRPTRPFRHGL